MRLIRQLALLVRLTLAMSWQRPTISLVVIFGVTCVVGALLSTLSMSVGLISAYEAAGDPARVMITSSQALNEYTSSVSRNAVDRILSLPGIARGEDGAIIADPEVLIALPPAKGFPQGSLFVRGIGPQGLSLRPGFQIDTGRMFNPGARELVIGSGASKQFNLRVGDTVILPDGEWPIVGGFSSGGSIAEGEIMADVTTLMSASRSELSFSSIQVALSSAGDFDAFSRELDNMPGINVQAERQSDYFARTAARYTAFFKVVAYTITIMMAIGSLFGSMKILYMAVSSRTRELGTLRAIGFDRFPVAASVMIEALILSLLGAVLGTLFAWLIFDGRQESYFQNVFRLKVSNDLIALGFLWAVVLAFLGGFPPAYRASRLNVINVLRS